MLHPYLIEASAAGRQHEQRARAQRHRDEGGLRAVEAHEQAVRRPRVRLAVVAARVSLTGRWIKRPSPAAQANL